MSQVASASFSDSHQGNIPLLTRDLSVTANKHAPAPTRDPDLGSTLVAAAGRLTCSRPTADESQVPGGSRCSSVEAASFSYLG